MPLARRRAGQVARQGRGLERLGCPRGGANPSFTFLLGRTQSRARAPALGVRAGRAVRPRPVPRAGVARPAARLGRLG
jgi:hypothetical protein